MGRSRGAPAPARSASSAASRPKPASSSSSSPPPQSSSSWGQPRPSAPPPMQAQGAAPPAMQGGGGGGMFSGLMGSLVTGAAMGTGSAIAHRAVDSMMGPRTVVHEHQGAPEQQAPAAPMHMGGSQAEGPCGGSVKQFADCMSRYNGDMGACTEYFNAMQQCKINYNMA